MKTVRVNLKPLERNVASVEKPNLIDRSFEEHSVSKWRYLDEESEFYLESVKHIDGPTCYDELLQCYDDD